MSRIHLRSHTLLLWLSLCAAAAAALLSAGCSSSDDPGATASAGKGGGSSGGATGKAGTSSDASDAGEAAVGGETGETDETPDTGGGGRGTTASGGKGGAAGSVAGSSSSGGNAGEPGAPAEPGEGGAGGSPDAVDPEVTAAQARALALINSLNTEEKCTACHDVSYRGAGFYPNITPDVETGIGSWDAEDIKTAIRDGKDKDGKTLCSTMERYPFTDDQLSDIAIFLMHLPPVSKKITGKCPSL